MVVTLCHRLLLLLLLCVLQLNPTVGAFTTIEAGKELKTTGHGKSQVLHLAALLPYTYSTHGGNGVELAYVMALDAINADPNVLPAVELQILASNSGCDKDTAQLAMMKQM
jgi:hypothetical protein